MLVRGVPEGNVRRAFVLAELAYWDVIAALELLQPGDVADPQGLRERGNNVLAAMEILHEDVRRLLRVQPPPMPQPPPRPRPRQPAPVLLPAMALILATPPLVMPYIVGMVAVCVYWWRQE